MSKTILLAFAALAALATATSANARAAKTALPDQFFGEWCSPSPDPDVKNKVWYTLPSWTEDGHCTNIFSIDRYGFRFGEGKQCEPVSMRLGEGNAPSGSSYTATVTARCQGQLQSFEFYRYKGSLGVTTK